MPSSSKPPNVLKMGRDFNLENVAASIEVRCRLKSIVS